MGVAVIVGTDKGGVIARVFSSPDRGDRWIEWPCTLPKILCVEAFAL